MILYGYSFTHKSQNGENDTCTSIKNHWQYKWNELATGGNQVWDKIRFVKISFQLFVIHRTVFSGTRGQWSFFWFLFLFLSLSSLFKFILMIITIINIIINNLKPYQKLQSCCFWNNDYIILINFSFPFSHGTILISLHYFKELPREYI